MYQKPNHTLKFSSYEEFDQHLKGLSTPEQVSELIRQLEETVAYINAQLESSRDLSDLGVEPLDKRWYRSATYSAKAFELNLRRAREHLDEMKRKR